MIIRRKHTANYATISNALANDERLQADEIGVLYYLLTRPHDWEVRRPALAKRFRYGRDAIKRVLWNGMRFGWIVAQKTQLSDGRFFTVYEVRDEPGPALSDDEIRRALSLGSSEAGVSVDDGADADEGPDTGDPPATPDPATGQPGVAQPATGNTYVASKEEATNDGFTKDKPTKSARDFARVLDKWPKDHVLSRVTAEAALAGLTDKDFGDCEAGISPYLSECKGSNRKVCDLTTYVRERRWERFIRQGSATEATTAKPYSPQWYRWREYKLAIGESVTLMEEWAKQGRGWTTRSEWPPPIPKKSESAA